MISIPLISFSSFRELSQAPDFKSGWPDSVPRTCFEIRSAENLSESCYAVKIEDASMAPVLNLDMIGVFSAVASKTPVIRNIFAIGLRDNAPVIRQVVKNEISRTDDESNDSLSAKIVKRKSFMTPTPLHIPGSSVSPIPESAHESVFLKRFDQPGRLTVVPGANVLWMHPLVLTEKNY